MKIELKNIKTNLRMSEETTCFVADIYVNGKKIGYARNSGTGGATNYQAFEFKGIDVLKNANQFCETLPAKDYGEFSVPMNLEHFIDCIIEDHLKAKDIANFENKISKAMMMGIVVGVNGEFFRVYKTTAPIVSFPKDALDRVIEQVKQRMKEGEVILNTNL